MRRYNILLDCSRNESTDGNFGTYEKVAIPIPIFGIFVFPFPWDYHGCLTGMGIRFPMH